MRRAIALSRRGHPAPNPRVGCVIVRDGRVVGEGFHAYAGGPHAEVVALAEAGDEALGARVFVTLAPCNHTGRTGPCSEALLAAGVAEVVAAVDDPNPVAAGGMARLAAAGVRVSSGLLAEEAESANRAFLTAVRRGWAYVTLKAAMSLDGRISAARGQSTRITGEAARREAHRLRAEAGCVLVGRGTVEADDPRLTVRGFRVRNQPVRVILDPSGELSRSHAVFAGPGGSWQVVRGPAGPGQISVKYGSGGFDLRELLHSLYGLGVTAVLVEGGGKTIGSFLASGLGDRVELFVAPFVLGDGPMWAEGLSGGTVRETAGFRLERVRRLGSDAQLSLVRD